MRIESTAHDAWKLTAGCVAALLLLVTAGCGDGRRGTGGEAAEDAHETSEHASDGQHRDGVVVLTADQLAAIEIGTAPVERRHLAALLETTGEVGYEEDRIAHVAPRVPGRVHRVPVSLGDEVGRGDTLAVLDSVELGQARAAFLVARTREDLARQSREREERLFADRITSERELQEARAGHLEAVAARRSAQETLRLYGIPESELKAQPAGAPGASLLPVRAPIAGRVVDKHATLGELATPGDTLFTIADLGHVWIWIDVYERDLSRVHLGDGVEVRVEPFPGRLFSGEVTYLSPEVEEETRTVRARIDVANEGRHLRPGMFATVRVNDPHTEEAEASLVVPEAALVRRGDEHVVFVPLEADTDLPAGGARFTAAAVTPGRRESGWVEILSGLTAGQTAVTKGAFFLESELARDELGGGHRH